MDGGSKEKNDENALSQSELDDDVDSDPHNLSDDDFFDDKNN